MNHYRIRVSRQPSPKEERWQIIENDTVLEKRAPYVKINVPSYTEEDLEEEYREEAGGNIIKCRFYLACDGIGAWQDNIFVISEA